jgi:hypothetical protein
MLPDLHKTMWPTSSNRGRTRWFAADVRRPNTGPRKFVHCFDPSSESSPGWHEAKKRAPELEKLRPYVEGMAKNLIDKVYGPDGPVWGTKLTEIEDLVVAIREVLSEKMVADALARQAAAQADSPAGYPTCPGRQQPLACPDTNELLVQTSAGEAAWAEPKGYCDRCRRSFIPSVHEPGP